MGPIEAAPLTVAQIGRRMGLTRQAVQRTADILVMEGIAEFNPNPDHRRAHLLALTPRGAELLRQISRAEVAWADELAAQFGTSRLREAAATLHALRTAIDQHQGVER